MSAAPGPHGRPDLLVARDVEASYSQSIVTSGGEQQTVAIGRVLMARPRLMLLDEPSIGLAPLVIEDIFAALEKLDREEGLSLLLAEQDAALSLRHAHRAYVLENGRAVLDGEAATLRLRLRWLHRFFGSTPGTPEHDVVRWLNRRVGCRDVDHFMAAGDLLSLVGEMDAAGIGVGVMVGRSTPTVRVANDDLAALAGLSAGRLVGIASVDPIELGTEGALAEIRRAVRDLGLLGVNFDAGFYARPLKADADELMPLYEECLHLQVPALVMSGPTTPDLSFNDPLAVDAVARTFPKLPIVCCHGFYPHVAEIVAVAFRKENVFVSPDMYLFGPGGRLYVEAANGFMQDQLLFGSSYPFRPMAQGVADLRGIGLGLAVVEKVCSATPRRVLGMR